MLRTRHAVIPTTRASNKSPRSSHGFTPLVAAAVLCGSANVAYAAIQARPDSASVQSGKTTVIKVLKNDAGLSKKAVISIIRSPDQGSARVRKKDNAILYAAPTGYAGKTRMKYRVRDLRRKKRDAATVTVKVRCKSCSASSNTRSKQASPNALPNVDPVGSPKKWYPGHYVMAGDGKNQGLSKWFRNHHFVGMQAYFDWGDLESSPGKYNFSAIERVLNQLKGTKMKLSMKIRYKTFNKHARRGSCAPKYIHSMNGVDTGPKHRRKCIARIYIPEVKRAFIQLGKALGAKYDKHPALASVVVEETAGPGNGHRAFSPQAYLDALQDSLKGLRDAFPTTVVLQQANYFPGKKASQAMMDKLLIFGYEHGVGFSGPDLMPNTETNATKRFPNYSGLMPLAMDMQNTTRRGKTTPEKALRYAVDELGLNFLFWTHGRSGKWDLDNVEPLIRRSENQLSSRCPINIKCKN